MSTATSNRFSLIEIEDATKNFENILGRGGESIVYFGQISGIGKVAVKKLKSNLIDFQEEIEIISRIKHPNLVPLHGYCDESNQKILVYEYMEKGSLSNYIIKKKKRCTSTICLSWRQRLNICLGAGYGLKYLHKEREKLPKGIIHRDVKPDNILLDDNWVAKVSDFGMCKLSHDGQIKSTMVSLLKGTSGYCAPEYVKYGRLSRKIDVYAFGVVLFQVLCRKMPWDRDDESYYRSDDEDLGLWARENVDPEISEEISEDCLEIFTHIIGRSLLQDPSTRPTMDDVVIDLENALKCQDEGIRPKSTSSWRKVSIPGSVQKMIQNIKEMKIIKNTEAEIYAVLKECSMNPFQTIQKLVMTASGGAFEGSESSGVPGGASPAGLITVDNSVEFSYEELAKATDDFCLASKIGEGDFAAVYYAELRGEKAAIKKMDMQASRQFLAELKFVTHVHHLNLVRLIGYCLKSCLFLVYEFIENGNLSQHLHSSGSRDPLPWATRIQIALDSARGLEYMHEHAVPVYIHRNIKSANILIDKNFRAKVTDFGLTKLIEDGSNSMPTSLVGSFGYIAPEYALYGDVSPKVDTFAFGVVLYELISAKEAVVRASGFITEPIGLVTLFEGVLSEPNPKYDLVKLIDPRLNDYPIESVGKMAQLARACTHENPQLRPSMRSIVVALMTLSSTMEDWDVGSFYEN